MSVGSMTAFDMIGLLGSAVAAITLLLRRNMLGHQLGTWHSAPWPVQAALSGMALYMAGCALSILCGAHAGQREAFAYLVMGAASFILLINLDQTGRVDDEAGS